LREKEFSPVELTEACLHELFTDDRLHSFITITADLRQRKQAEQELNSGKDRGPLHGIPIALKDLYATKGIRTTCHSAVLGNWLPDRDATTVIKLRESGTILLGKLGMHEFAFGGPSVDAPFPAVRNPWNTAHIPGGSSSGSGAALAAGFCYGALGRYRRSIRTPSSHCGIVGIKSFGRNQPRRRHPSVGRRSRRPDGAAVETARSCYNARRPRRMDNASANMPVPNFQTGMKTESVCALRPRKNWFDENLESLRKPKWSSIKH
jgi:aspartyl-tRNA(Asn)/glutamyl-tRNA(Gln) amidotransferase subunit A